MPLTAETMAASSEHRSGDHARSARTIKLTLEIEVPAEGAPAPRTGEGPMAMMEASPAEVDEAIKPGEAAEENGVAIVEMQDASTLGLRSRRSSLSKAAPSKIIIATAAGMAGALVPPLSSPPPILHSPIVPPRPPSARPSAMIVKPSSPNFNGDDTIGQWDAYSPPYVTPRHLASLLSAPKPTSPSFSNAILQRAAIRPPGHAHAKSVEPMSGEHTSNGVAGLLDADSKRSQRPTAARPIVRARSAEPRERLGLGAGHQMPGRQLLVACLAAISTTRTLLTPLWSLQAEHAQGHFPRPTLVERQQELYERQRLRRYERELVLLPRTLDRY
jgi:hypothetical protein